MNKISVFGVGFIGKHFIKMFPNETIKISSGEFLPLSETVLYMRSTVDNYGSPEENVEINLIKLIKVLRELKPKTRFVYISSWFCFGPVNHYKTVSETENEKVLGYYGATKLCAEQIVETYCKINNINFLILRLSNIVGKNDNPSAQKNALQFLIEKLRADEPIELYNNGNFYRSYLHVEECCRAIKFLIEKAEWNQTYNVGPEETTWKFSEIIKYCADKLNSKSIISGREPSSFHKIVQVPSFRINTDKLKRLKFQWKLNIRETLDKIIFEEKIEN